MSAVWHEFEEEVGPSYRQDLHLASAILYSEVEFLWKYQNQKRQWFSHKKMMEMCKGRLPKWIIDPVMTTSTHRLMMLIAQRAKVDREDGDKLRTRLSAALIALTWGRQAILQGNDTRDVSWVRNQVMSLASDPDLLALYAQRRWTRMIVKTAGKQKKDATLSVLGIQLIFSGNLGFWEYGGDVNVDPWSIFCCLNDIVSGRFTTMLYTKIADILDPHPSGNRTSRVKDMLRLMDEVVMDHGNIAYDLFKVIPSVVIGHFLRTEEPEGGKVFFNALKTDLTQNHKLSRTRLFRFLTTYDTKTESQLFFELAGLWKMAGHPVIEVKKGIMKMHDRGGYMTLDVEDEAQRAADEFKYQFTLEYWQKHRKWPPMTFSTDTPTIIRTSYAQSIWPSGRIKPKDFRTSKFGKLFSFDYNPDLLELIEDKSIIPELASWPSEYAWAARVAIHGRERQLMTTRSQTKRLVMAYLRDPEPSLKKVIETVEETGSLLKEDLVIVLNFKERELKREGRLFAKATFPARLYQAGTERAVGNDILGYLPYQSMTLSEAQLTNRLALYSDHLRIGSKTKKFMALVLDFSGWNLRFRAETMGPLYQCFDDLYGFKNVFKFSQLFPMLSVILVKDEFRPPPMNRMTGLPMECLTCYYGSECWNEGMRQKPWTVLTMMLILGIARELRTHVSLTGQGDNQVIMLGIPGEQELNNLQQTPTQYAQSFLHKLSVKCLAIGIPLKPEETWISGRVLEYARQYFIDGVQVPATLKKMTRLHSLTNEDFPTVASDVSTVFSAGCSGANLASDPDPVYLTTIVEAIEAIDYNWPKLVESLDPNHLAALVSTNRTLGGLPCSLYPDFLIRGLPDPLASNISIRHAAWITCPDSRTALWRTRPLPSRHVDPGMLVKDPVSLPLLLPVQAENYIRKTLEVALKENAINKMVARLLSTAADESEKCLINDLLQLKPFNPKVAHEFYLLSNAGLRVKLLGRFYKTRSLAQASSVNPRAILAKIAQHERQALDYYMRRFIDIPPVNYPPELLYTGFRPRLEGWCSTDVARQLRQKWWGMDVEGITQAPPWEQGFLCHYDKIPTRLLSASLLFNVLPITHDGSSCPDRQKKQQGPSGQPLNKGTRLDYIWTRGRAAPYLGSQTKEKFKKPILQTAEVGSILASMKRIVTVFEWLREPNDPNLQALRDILLSEKTDLGVEDLVLVAPRVYGGCPTHRLHAHAVPSGSTYCGLLTFATHVRFSSSGATRFARSVDNYTVMFQQLFLYATSHLMLRCLAGESVQGEWGLVILCDGCTEFIPETRAMLAKAPTYRGILCFDRVTSIQMRDQLPTLGPTLICPKIESAALIAAKAVAAMMSEDAMQAYTYEHPETMSSSTIYPVTDFARTDLKAMLSCVAIYMTSLQSLFQEQPIGPGDDIDYTASTVFFMPEITMDPRMIPLQTLARALLTSGRVWELFQLCPTMTRFHNSVITVKGVVQLLVQVIRSLQATNCRRALKIANLVPFDTPLATYLRQWELCIINEYGRRAHHLIKMLNKLRPLLTSLDEPLQNLQDVILTNAADYQVLDGEAQSLLNVAPERTRPEGIVIDELRSGIITAHSISDTRDLLLPIPPDDTVMILVMVDHDNTPEEPYVPPAPIKSSKARLCHITRVVGNVSTSISKVLDILTCAEPYQVTPYTVAVCVAEGAGSILSGLLHLYPTLLGYYNSLLPESDRGDDPCVYYPPALIADPCNLTGRLMGADEMRAGYRDLTHPGTINKIVSTVVEANWQLSFLTMDAEVTDSTVYRQLLLSTIELIYRVAGPTTVIIIKLFLSCPEAAILIGVLSASCATTKLVKPPASDRESTEVYLLAQGFERSHWPIDLTATKAGNNAIRHYCHRRHQLLQMDNGDYARSLTYEANRLASSLLTCPCLSTVTQAMNIFHFRRPDGNPLDRLMEARRDLEQAAIRLKNQHTCGSVDSHALEKHLMHRGLRTHMEGVVRQRNEIWLAERLIDIGPDRIHQAVEEAMTDQFRIPIHFHLRGSIHFCMSNRCVTDTDPTPKSIVRLDISVCELFDKIRRPILHLYHCRVPGEEGRFVRRKPRIGYRGRGRGRKIPLYQM
ncbi:putative RNA dependent RNA polymerase [Socyvirus heteroderae]|uniref:RNA-directed RNA polymerase L n=1 Tax=Socyvirus heteroderae TaxID=1034377 RepID=G0WXQ2_9MONO|nr:putative RNA dependent RNA polymerase [Socyvirus heteroderae]AEF56729.1 putative RNA dependent RNA polymerase [Socyvirus heteroderae]